MVLVRSENVLRLASESYVTRTIVVQVESLVVQMANAPSLVLERRAIIPQIVHRVKPAVTLAKTPLGLAINLVLENHVDSNDGTNCLSVSAPRANGVVVLVKDAV